MVRFAFVLLLGWCGTLAGQQRAQAFQVSDVLAALEDKTGAVPGDVKPIQRLTRLVDAVMKREAQEAVRPAAARTIVRVAGNEQILYVQGGKDVAELVQSVLDQMQCEQLPRLHLACTVLVMPVALAASYGLVTNRVQDADMVAITRLMKDVVKAKGTLLNLPEVIATPFVPFVAEPRIGAAAKPAPPNVANLRLRGEAVALSSDEALLAVQFVRGSLPEDRTVLPKRPLCDQAFRLRAGSGVTMMAKDGKTAIVMWLRFTGSSNEAPKAGKPVIR